MPRAASGLSVDSVSSYSILATGRVRPAKASGVATIASGTKSITVTPGTALGGTFGFATLQGSAGGTTTVHQVAIDSAVNKLTIHLTANATVAVKVSWLVLG